ncbi:MAG TPA: polysaccharide deacetylase family protein [Vicinamibacterales bacterium]
MTSSSCLVVMYHYVRDGEATAFPRIRALPPALFDQQLDWLEREYSVVAPADVAAAVAGRATLPADAAALTFDDGFIDHYVTVLPMLAARGLKGLFFVTSGTVGAARKVPAVHKTHFLLAALGAEAFGRGVLQERDRVLAVSREGGPAARVFGADAWEHADERAIKNLLNYELPFEVADRILDALFSRHVGDEQMFAQALYLDGNMIREMARAGMAFGYHTRSHRMLSRLSPAGQDRELRDGVAWIRELTGQQEVSFCYPWGGPGTYTAETVRLLQRHGYSMAYNTIRRRMVIGRDGPFELPRLDTRDLPPYTAGEPASSIASGVSEPA